MLFGGMTAFAQAFTHAIARYACEESLANILNRVNFYFYNMKFN
jgi:hypothetical protein